MVHLIVHECITQVFQHCLPGGPLAVVWLTSDEVCRHDGAEAVRNHQGSPPGHEPLQCCLHQSL